MDYKKSFEALIDILIREDGSDLHISAGRFPAVRVNGELIFLLNRAVIAQEDVSGMLKAILSEDHYKHFLQVEELDFSYDYQGKIRLRGNAFVQQGKLAMALRLIPEVKTLEGLNLPPLLGEFARKRQGFFLVVGPVGQGKSATMASMVRLINEERPAHILTIEDPVEYTYTQGKSIIDQREIGIDTADFQGALNSAFRQDVNVILIGEMRNAETIGTAVTAAETGHLVLSTLHTNNASQTIDRIIDSFPATQQDQIRVQLASSLIGVFSQRLIPRITGGRIPAYELLINNNAVANLIREKRTHEIDMVIETGSEQGMIDMNRSLLDLVRRGEITIENAYAYALNPKSL
ncbi:MAG: twitching motility protein twitching motility protein PilT, partial [Candidatus Nomurabacteria bacterium]|nr:twitching motility protein twitching motility protein PilT [Candidatus Nomurabacteria bacterium]